MERDPLENPQPLIRRVYAYVAYRVGDGPDAEDITSAAFERGLRYRHTFDATRGDPVSWLIGIASRCVSDHFSTRPELVTEPPEISAPGELEVDVARRVDLQRAVGSLDERDRELLALRYGADLTARQIAELYGLRTNTVEVGLHRMLKALREALDQPAERPGEPSRPRRREAAE